MEILLDMTKMERILKNDITNVTRKEFAMYRKMSNLVVATLTVVDSELNIAIQPITIKDIYKNCDN
jgi:hypothetical protein